MLPQELRTNRAIHQHSDDFRQNKVDSDSYKEQLSADSSSDSQTNEGALNQGKHEARPLEALLGRRRKDEEVFRFATTCPHCQESTETCMYRTDIPHFKEVIIMSLRCDACGYKSNEIKGGG